MALGLPVGVAEGEGLGEEEGDGDGDGAGVTAIDPGDEATDTPSAGRAKIFPSNFPLNDKSVVDPFSVTAVTLNSRAPPCKAPEKDITCE